MQFTATIYRDDLELSYPRDIEAHDIDQAATRAINSCDAGEFVGAVRQTDLPLAIHNDAYRPSRGRTQVLGS